MRIGILAKNARNIILDNVYIRGFDCGIALENSKALLNRVHVSHSGIGLIARKSYVTLNRSVFLKNKIDILVEITSLEMIDTVARIIKAYLSNVSTIYYNINPYQLISQANEVLRESKPVFKRIKFKALLKKLINYAEHVVTVYELIKIIFRLLGVSLS